MLAGYGYVYRSAKGTVDKYDKGIPNVNNGLINLPHGAVRMANNARW